MGHDSDLDHSRRAPHGRTPPEALGRWRPISRRCRSRRACRSSTCCAAASATSASSAQLCGYTSANISRHLALADAAWAGGAREPRHQRVLPDRRRVGVRAVRSGVRQHRAPARSLGQRPPGVRTQRPARAQGAGRAGRSGGENRQAAASLPQPSQQRHPVGTRVSSGVLADDPQANTAIRSSACRGWDVRICTASTDSSASDGSRPAALRRRRRCRNISTSTSKSRMTKATPHSAASRRACDALASAQKGGIEDRVASPLSERPQRTGAGGHRWPPSWPARRGPAAARRGDRADPCRPGACARRRRGSGWRPRPRPGPGSASTCRCPNSHG